MTNQDSGFADETRKRSISRLETKCTLFELFYIIIMTIIIIIMTIVTIIIIMTIIIIILLKKKRHSINKKSMLARTKNIMQSDFLEVI